jgi:hypothetical protein
MQEDTDESTTQLPTMLEQQAEEDTMAVEPENTCEGEKEQHNASPKRKEPGTKMPKAKRRRSEGRP